MILDPNIAKLLIAIASGLIGVFFGHYLTKDRDAKMRQSILDREADLRRRHFRRVVRRCRYELERTSDNDPEGVWRKYCAMATEILSEAAFAAGDFPDHDALMELVTKAGEWRHIDVAAFARQNGKSIREVLRDSIKAVDDFAK